jgi:predicted PurR-regulated permease PerM
VAWNTEVAVISSGGVMNARIPVRFLLLALLAVFLAAGCEPGYVRYNRVTGEPTGSGVDVWYTVIAAVVTFVVGFFVAATMSRNGGIRLSLHRHRHHRRTEAGWNRIREHIQAGTSQGLAEWRSTGHAGDADWADLSRRIEERILEEMHKHHD